MTELVEAGVAKPQTQIAGVSEVLGHVAVEDLEGTFDARACRDRGLRGSTEVGVIEVDEAIGSGPDFAPLMLGSSAE